MSNPFDARRLIADLENFANTIGVLLADCSDEDSRWRPASGNWSILEIVCHLADEECEDFRRRLRMTLQQPGEAWPGVDPEQWAQERKYNEQSLAESMDRFIAARRESVDWLRSLDRPDWNQSYRHEKLGDIRAGDLLAAWSAHDRLHLRQIAKRQYELIQRDAGEYSTGYAGNWT